MLSAVASAGPTHVGAHSDPGETVSGMASVSELAPGSAQKPSSEDPTATAAWASDAAALSFTAGSPGTCGRAWAEAGSRQGRRWASAALATPPLWFCGFSPFYVPFIWGLFYSKHSRKVSNLGAWRVHS